MGKSAAKSKARTHQPRSGKQINQPTTHDLLKKAICYHREGNSAHAAKIYREVLAVNPRDPDALHLLGLVALEAHNHDEAKRLIQQAIINFPTMPSFHVDLGRVHTDSGEFEMARACFEAAIKLQPDYADAHFQMGNLHRFRRQEELAIACYQQVLRLSPDHAPALNNLGNSLKVLGRFDEAISCYQQAVKIDPTLAEAHTNMGNAYKDMNKPQEAIACYQKALAVRPQYADPYNNIGYILQCQGRLSEALVYLDKALEIKPQESGILHNIGNVYKDMGEFEQAITVYRQALAIKPDFTSVHSNILFALNYADNVDPAVMHDEARQWWQQQAAAVANRFRFDKRSPMAGRRLKIGYVSPDFCVHSVSFFLLSLLQSHDKSRFEIFCYADVRRPDEMTATLQGHSDHWRSILGLSDESVAQQIFNDQIDILIDLAGHTSDNRLLVFARKPAPVQVSWLGYPNTTGLATMDYRLTDHIADPEGTTDQFYTEKLFRLHRAFLCYTPWISAPEISDPPVTNRGQVTFGSFNNITKLTKRAIGVWAEILKKVPNSRLFLKDTILADPQSRERFLALFITHGVEANRIVLLPRTDSPTDHLALYQEMDIGLDPFPYNGATTTCEALWMGVPVISLRGEVHAARVGATLLSHMGHSELIAESVEEYVRLAVSLAGDPQRLIHFRQAARQQLTASSLCDAGQFARAMEAAFTQMWNSWGAEEGIILPPSNTINCSSVQQGDHPLGAERKLHIGGKQKHPDWEIFNAIGAPEVDHVGDAKDLSRFADNTFSEIYASHVLEHFDYKNEIGLVLHEWHRVLKHGGRLYVSVPDIDKLASLLLQKEKLTLPQRFHVMRMIFGGHIDAYDYHQVGFNLEFLASFLIGSGFTNIRAVDGFGIFDDTSALCLFGNPISVNVIAEKPTGKGNSSVSSCQGLVFTDSPAELPYCRVLNSDKNVGTEGVPKAETSKSELQPQNLQPDVGRLIVDVGLGVAIPTDQANRLNQLGNQSCRQGRLTEAEDYFTQALACCPDSPLLLVNLGVVKNDLGRPAEALEDLKRAIRLQPDFAEAHFNMANALVQLDLATEAVSFYQKAIQCKPDYIDAYKNLGSVLISLGQPKDAILVLGEAEKQSINNVGILHLLSQAAMAMKKPEEALAYAQKAVETNPQSAEAFENLGMLYYHSSRRLSEATTALEQAIALRPNNCLTHNNLGLVYNNLQEYGKAITQYQQALTLEPNNAILFFNLGITLGNMGRIENAITAYRQAISLRPGYTDAILNLAHACRTLGDNVEAETLYWQVMDLAPTDAVALHNLGILNLAHHKPLDAWQYCHKAVDMEPTNRLYTQQLALCLAQATPIPDTQDFENDLLRCLAMDGIYRDPLTKPAITLLQNKPAFTAAQAVISDSMQLATMLAAGQLEIISSPLLLLILEHTVVNSPELEKLLTALRRNLLLQPLSLSAPAASQQATLAFSVALAHQCFVNEYLYQETEEETLQIQRLQTALEQALAEGTPIMPSMMAMIGCYLPLWKVRNAKQLLARPELADHGLLQMIVRQVQEPLEEQELQPSIATLFAIDNRVSQQVRDQYEENPYPPWTDLPVLAPPCSLSMQLRQTFPFLQPEEILVSTTPEILVAGCGTGRQAIQTSQSYTGSTILAVDLSRASLAYAQRKAKQFGFTNITFAQADILTLGGLHRQFDLIACSGVLHHMQEPLSGWQVLVSLLKPGGFMKIALYSEVARQPIVAAREFIKQQGFPATPSGIRACRQAIMDSTIDPLLVKLPQLHDFYSLSECRDLLFHVQEHRFTMQQLRKAIEQLGLTFLGFTFNNPTILADYHACYPNDKRGNSWENWHDYELAHPDLFLGMYTFWVQLPVSASN